jgi:hypothetical protein
VSLVRMPAIALTPGGVATWQSIVLSR